MKRTLKWESDVRMGWARAMAPKELVREVKAEAKGVVARYR